MEDVDTCPAVAASAPSNSQCSHAHTKTTMTSPYNTRLRRKQLALAGKYSVDSLSATLATDLSIDCAAARHRVATSKPSIKSVVKSSKPKRSQRNQAMVNLSSNSMTTSTPMVHQNEKENAVLPQHSHHTRHPHYRHTSASSASSIASQKSSPMAYPSSTKTAPMSVQFAINLNGTNSPSRATKPPTPSKTHPLNGIVKRRGLKQLQQPTNASSSIITTSASTQPNLRRSQRISVVPIHSPSSFAIRDPFLMSPARVIIMHDHADLIGKELFRQENDVMETRRRRM